MGGDFDAIGWGVGGLVNESDKPCNDDNNNGKDAQPCAPRRAMRERRNIVGIAVARSRSGAERRFVFECRV